MRRLPPFPELIAFEAVARHSSFTRAAAELCITQSAVSHRVSRLEKYFGVQLFRRINPGIALTEAGASLLPELQALLDGLAGLGARRERRLRVAAGSALCTWWLAGRLSAFMKSCPGVSVELVPIENDAANIPEVDVRILWVGESDAAPSATQTPLFNEHVFPVCSPTLLPNGRPLGNRRDVAAMTLLHKSAHASGEWSWDAWIDRLGFDRKRTAGELRFGDMSLVMSAVVEGAGVALARSLLAHDALCDGRLAIAVADIDPIISTKKHVARWRRNKADDPDIKSFVEWLVAEARRTLANVDELLHSKSKDVAAMRAAR